MLSFFRVHQHFVIRASAETSPDLLARFGVISGEVSSNAIFTTTDSNIDLVFHNYRRAGAGCPFLGITIFH